METRAPAATAPADSQKNINDYQKIRETLEAMSKTAAEQMKDPKSSTFKNWAVLALNNLILHKEQIKIEGMISAALNGGINNSAFLDKVLLTALKISLPDMDTKAKYEVDEKLKDIDIRITMEEEAAKKAEDEAEKPDKKEEKEEKEEKEKLLKAEEEKEEEKAEKDEEKEKEHEETPKFTPRR
jgi:hypothetical protein